MKKYKLTALLLATAMALPMTGCEFAKEYLGMITGTFEPTLSDSNMEIQQDEASVYVENAGYVYNHMQYTKEMFYGKYIADGTVNTEMDEAARDAFIEQNEKFSITGSHARMTVMPYRIDIGPHCNVTPLNYLSGYDWAQLYYYDIQGNSVQVQAAYTLDGNAINFQLIRSYDYDPDAGTLDYVFSGDTLKYYYAFGENTLKLSNSSGSVVLYPEDLHTETPQYNIYDAGLLEGSPALDGIEKINITADESYVVVNGVECPLTARDLSKDGLFKAIWEADGVKHSVQAAYFYCDDDGLVLADGEQCYYYTHRSNDLYTRSVSTNLRVADSEQLQNLSDAELNALLGQVDELYADLEAAFQSAGVAATINADTGEISLNSVVLFAVDDYFISAEGQGVLTDFLKAYTSVIFSEKYSGFVSSIIIEGHTDPTGLTEHNQVLSQARAEQVMNYCLSPDSGLDAERIGKLTPMLSAVGYAASHPVFGADGEVDLDASRRVSFRFILDPTKASE